MDQDQITLLPTAMDWDSDGELCPEDFHHLLERLQEKTARYSQQIGVSPTGMSLRNFRSRWGSCDKRGQVVFNWNIIKAPHSVVDYVVIHELCHLIYPNHSKDFWQLVGRHDAAYTEHRQWLKERGRGLL